MTGLNTARMEANVVVLGTDSVGKSALTVRFLTRRFIGEYGDIESIFSHSITVDGREQTLNIWDSPFSQVITHETGCWHVSQQDLSPESTTYEKRLQWADGFVLVYSICDRASFNTIGKLLQSIKATKDYAGLQNVPIVIVGNKRDLHHRRTVLSEEGRLLALSADCQFYEVSAAENYHSVLMVFHGLVNRVRESRSAGKKPAGIKGIVKSMSAVFARRRTDSL
ncbi:ras-related and estrogen-regulated growth inhibitor-like protein isoform X1 [Astyanax mexicanus]|uniref:small monomeric GTPase n=1 Tax=Astyanax mexicanus TaxID=7994 RepID=A0A3B1K9C4_ASTMX|nr:ras-related and estrogen-regulated growth inhibitor-like protein isoform X1 [Astyanax mexicanus]